MSIREHHRVEGEERQVGFEWTYTYLDEVTDRYVTATKDLLGSSSLQYYAEREDQPSTTLTGAATFMDDGADGRIQTNWPSSPPGLAAVSSQRPSRWRFQFQVDHPLDGVIRSPSQFDDPFIVVVHPKVGA